MNYLAHLYLSDPDPEIQLGNLLGDSVKGRLNAEDWPAGVLRGLRQHRAVDRMAQSSPAVLRSKARIDDRFGYFKPILVDVFYDHLLAAHWQRFYPSPLNEFAAGIYRLFDRYHPLLPDEFRPIAAAMRQRDWLTSYAQEEVVDLVLRRLGERLRRPSPLAEGGPQLHLQRIGLTTDLADFLKETAASLRAWDEPGDS